MCDNIVNEFKKTLKHSIVVHKNIFYRIIDKRVLNIYYNS